MLNVTRETRVQKSHNELPEIEVNHSHKLTRQISHVSASTWVYASLRVITTSTFVHLCSMSAAVVSQSARHSSHSYGRVEWRDRVVRLWHPLHLRRVSGRRAQAVNEYNRLSSVGYERAGRIVSYVMAYLNFQENFFQ